MAYRPLDLSLDLWYYNHNSDASFNFVEHTIRGARNKSFDV